MSGTERPDPHCTVAVLASTARNAPTSPDLAAEVAALVGADRRVAAVECPAPFDLSVPTRPTSTGLVDLVNASQLDWLSLDDRFTADLLVARDPAALCYLGGAVAFESSGRAVLIADYSPRRHYDPVQVEQALLRAQVGEIRWLPATRTIALELADAVGADRVLPPRLWGVAAAPASAESEASPATARVGVTPPSTRLAARDLLSWAAATLPQDPDIEVWCPTRLRGLARGGGRSVFTPGPPRWSTQDLLRQVSHVLVPPTPGRGPHLHREAVLALQHGCVVVLDPAYRPHFADAALYTDEGTCQDWFELHAADPSTYVAQQRRARRFLERHLSAHALQRTVENLLAPAT